MLEITPLNQITGVHAGGSVSINLPRGLSYEKIHFEHSGVTPAQIQNFRVELNGRMLGEWRTLEEMRKENDYFKRPQGAGSTTLHFSRSEVKGVVNSDLVEQRFFALGTDGLSTIQIKFDIAQEAANPVIKATAEKGAAALPGWLFKRRTYRFNFAAGINEIDNIPRPIGAYIALIEIKKTGVTSAELLVDNVKWRDRISKGLHDQILQQRGRTPQADTHAIDLMLSGDIFACLALTDSIKDLRLRIECTEGGSAEVVVHYFDNYAASSF